MSPRLPPPPPNDSDQSITGGPTCLNIEVNYNILLPYGVYKL